ncbi:FAD-binding oxidoreductase [Roseobacter sp. OBYS 0001]|uniref:NAD(P)/FAD-dependent oxidoreductase n=1 Tax=Roseobacter sp. OBYS 0001 TaxID=882651 RepID=UPI001BC21E70|nr:FAD-dependent oxidoreductase [Roseobacter sp. OBYS 0001]GIT86029.1 glycerol-3-phosphate dehydrogenase [Roseobacter sp. OBYS 0001]
MVYDFIVMGAGMAGVSAAYELSQSASVLIIEAERQPGYHSSGRSAALFTRNYGTALVRKINALSEPFFQTPPEGFADGPLLRPRGALAVAGANHGDKIDAVLAAATPDHPVHQVTSREAVKMVPFLRLEYIARAAFEPGVSDIEVSTLLWAYLKGFKRRGGQIKTGEPVTALNQIAKNWAVTTCRETYYAKTIINACGAWADEVGTLAGAARIGLVAKRRTAIIVDATPGYDVAALPCVDFAENDAYIKPDAGKLMVSPGDATATPPQDAQPDEMDVAMLTDWLERQTLIPVRRIAHSWAGLRSFVPDENPVVGFDPLVPRFIWHAGQGGYGIMMAPALARAVASLAQDARLPSDFQAYHVTSDDLGPVRLAVQPDSTI